MCNSSCIYVPCLKYITISFPWELLKLALSNWLLDFIVITFSPMSLDLFADCDVGFFSWEEHMTFFHIFPLPIAVLGWEAKRCRSIMLSYSLNWFKIQFNFA